MIQAYPNGGGGVGGGYPHNHQAHPADDMQRFGRGQPLQPPQPSGPGLGPPRLGGPPGSRTPNRDHPPSGPFSTSSTTAVGDEYGGPGGLNTNRQYPDELDGIRVAGDDLHGGPSSSSFPPQPQGAAPPRPQPQGASLGGSEGQLPGHLTTAGGVGGIGGVGGGGGVMGGQRTGDPRTLKGAGGIPQIEITNDGHETLGGTGMPGGVVGINGGGRVPPIDGEYAYQNGGKKSFLLFFVCFSCDVFCFVLPVVFRFVLPVVFCFALSVVIHLVLTFVIPRYIYLPTVISMRLPGVKNQSEILKKTILN